MARTKRSGFTLRSGNSTPFKELGAKPMAPSKPGSSKEELLELSKDFITPVENIELDYGGSFDVDIEGSLPETKKGKTPSGPKPKPEPKPEKKRRKLGIKLPNWLKKKKKKGGVSIDLDFYRKSAEFNPKE